MKKLTTIQTDSAIATYYVAAPNSLVWTIDTYKMRPVQLKVMRIRTEHIAKDNVYGNELPYTERITYTLRGGIERDADQVFATLDDLIASMQTAE